jgi:hypothetical protein
MRIGCLVVGVLFFALSSSIPVEADVIVNEVMANEPGSYVQLEWIELYNNSDSAANMIDYTMIAGGTEITFPADLILGPRQYFIVCRRLYGDSASPGFEDTWGDSSGIWGDTEIEQGIQTPLQRTFSLKNTADDVVLVSSSGAGGRFLWSVSGADGVSWERVYPDSILVQQCQAPAGSTPGSQNSVYHATTGPNITHSFFSVSEHTGPLLYVTVENLGVDTINQCSLTVTSNLGEQVYAAELGPLAPGGRGGYMGSVSYNPRYYAFLHVKIHDTASTFIQETEIIAPASGFPPVLLSEFLANPKDLVSAEWVEVWNVSDTIIDVGAWLLGDRNRSVRIASSSQLLAPGEYIVLTEDSASLTSSYPIADLRMIQVNSWPTLNNDGDRIILTDEFGITADTVTYDEVFGDNRTWSRDVEDTARWGRSSDIGGSPGKPNSITIFEDVSVVALRIPYRKSSSSYPLPIYASAPLGSTYTLKIFDRQGRVVRTIVEDADFLAESYEWDGTSDSGSRLPLGLYIVYFEAAGYGLAKETVAIVR